MVADKAGSFEEILKGMQAQQDSYFAMQNQMLDALRDNLQRVQEAGADADGVGASGMRYWDVLSGGAFSSNAESAESGPAFTAETWQPYFTQAAWPQSGREAYENWTTFLTTLFEQGVDEAPKGEASNAGSAGAENPFMNWDWPNHMFGSSIHPWMAEQPLPFPDFFSHDPAAGLQQAFSSPLKAMAGWPEWVKKQWREYLAHQADGPKFADLATPQADAAAFLLELDGFQSAMDDFNRVVSQAWLRAYERFSAKHDLEELQKGDVREALDEWLEAANTELLAMQRSDEFLNAQRRVLRANLRFRQRMRDWAEEWSKAYQMPTRTEIDDLTQTVYQLRREVRALKDQLANQPVTGGGSRP